MCDGNIVPSVSVIFMQGKGGKGERGKGGKGGKRGKRGERGKGKGGIWEKLVAKNRYVLKAPLWESTLKTDLLLELSPLFPLSPFSPFPLFSLSRSPTGFRVLLRLLGQSLLVSSRNLNIIRGYKRGNSPLAGLTRRFPSLVDLLSPKALLHLRG